MSKLSLEVAECFEPLIAPKRYKGAWGGRGGGKSHFFAELMIIYCLRNPGMRAVCLREVQKTLAQSSKLLLEDKIEKYDLYSEGFKVFNDKIQTPGDGLIIFQGLQDHTAESIKSFEGLLVAWIEEAQTLSQRSLTLLRPTMRADGSEIWAGWNPRHKHDAIDIFLRQNKPDDAEVIKVTWRDNKRFPPVLEAERKLDLEKYPERYDHVWEGGYVRVWEGAYFVRELEAARSDGRIGLVTADPLLQLRAYVDIGGAGAKADANAIWICQFVGTEIRVLDYIEGVGQVIAYYVNAMRARGYDNAIVTLPHDGIVANNATGKRYEDHWRDAGFKVNTVPNQGAGAAMQRIEALRRIFHKMRFNEDTTEAGRDALGYYHEKRDEARNTGLGPDHDWSSNGADAAGLMAICYEEPRAKKRTEYRNVGWLG